MDTNSAERETVARPPRAVHGCLTLLTAIAVDSAWRYPAKLEERLYPLLLETGFKGKLSSDQKLTSFFMMSACIAGVRENEIASRPAMFLTFTSEPYSMSLEARSKRSLATASLMGT